jgi:glycerol uptake facilitator-like aquaporin
MSASTFSVPRRLAAEALGTALLLAIVVGSGIMAERLSDGNDAIALLANTGATGAGLYVLIVLLGPVSGAHFNPAVTLAACLGRTMSPALAAAYAGVQAAGAVAGVWLAHAMFAEPIVQVSTKLRDGPSQALSEAAATFGLVLTIIGTGRNAPQITPAAVALWITAAYWFTASTSFANPAVTLARSLSDTFAGIAPSSAPAFILAQFAAATAAVAVGAWLFKPETRP